MPFLKTHTSQEDLTCVHVSVLGAVIASGVGKNGKGGGESVGETDLILLKNSLPKLFVGTMLHGSLGKFNSSSPRSSVANKDRRDTDVIQIVAEVIKAVRRPHLSTTIKHNIVLKILTIPRAIIAVVLAISEKS